MFSQQKYNKKYKDITKTTIPKECRLEYCEFTLGEKEPSETGHWPLAQCVKKTKSVFLVIPSFSTLHTSPVFCSFPGLTPCEDKASNPPLNTTSTSTQTSPSCSWSTDQSLRHSPIVPLWSSDHPIPTHFTFWISTLSTTGGKSSNFCQLRMAREAAAVTAHKGAKKTKPRCTTTHFDNLPEKD